VLNCHDATFLLSQARERALSERERIDLGLHLDFCAACGHFGRQLPILGEAARTLAGKKDPDGL
jgi:hypothetical protein